MDALFEGQPLCGCALARRRVEVSVGVQRIYADHFGGASERGRACLGEPKVHHWRPALLRVVVAVVAVVVVVVTVVRSGSVENRSDTGCDTVSLLRLVEAWCSKGGRQEVGVEWWACWLRDCRTIGHRYQSPRRHQREYD